MILRIASLALVGVVADDLTTNQQSGNEFAMDFERLGTCPQDIQNFKGLSVANLHCDQVIEFFFVSKSQVLDDVRRFAHQIAEADDAFENLFPKTETARFDLIQQQHQLVSRTQGIMMANMHVLAAIVMQRKDCMTEPLRLMFDMTLTKQRKTLDQFFESTWLFLEDRPQEFSEKAKDWLAKVIEAMNVDIRVFKQMFPVYRVPHAIDTIYYSHELDGSMTILETLRREVFEEWPIDEGILRNSVQHIFPVDSSIGDVGKATRAGAYSQWYNDTGLVTAHAYDSLRDIGWVSEGKAEYANLTAEFQLGRKFDWMLCLETMEKLKPQNAAAFLSSLGNHAREGVIVSWATPQMPAVGENYPLKKAEAISAIAEGLGSGFSVDKEASDLLQGTATLPVLADAVYVFRRTGVSNPSAYESIGTTGLGAALCSPERHVAYSGMELETVEQIGNEGECCDRCSDTDGCKFWTYSGQAKTCWLKSAKEYQFSNDNFVSGMAMASF